MGGLRTGAPHPTQTSTSHTLDHPLRRQIKKFHGQLRRTHPSRASGANVETVLGPAQLQVRTPEAILHVTH
eukprot:2042046-Alexandrium_andersonii.AAC.1